MIKQREEAPRQCKIRQIEPANTQTTGIQTHEMKNYRTDFQRKTITKYIRVMRMRLRNVEKPLKMV